MDTKSSKNLQLKERFLNLQLASMLTRVTHGFDFQNILIEGHCTFFELHIFFLSDQSFQNSYCYFIEPYSFYL